MLGTLVVVRLISDSLVGLWACDTTFGPTIRGELAIQRAGNVWHASIRGLTLPVAVTGDSVRIALPDSLGQFRGRLREQDRVISGFWIQPPGFTLSQAYATPLVLRSTKRDVWIGTIVPLEDRFTLYLSISRRSDGSLAGVFRNPQQNWPGAWLRFALTQEGDSVRLAVPADNAQPGMRLAGRLDGRTLTLRVPESSQQLVLKPIDSTQAVGLYPRLPRGQPFGYRRPPQIGDGWRTARASDAGFDEAALARLVQQIVDTNPLDPRAPLIHSLLIARRGRLVLEEYFYGFTRDRPHDSRSAGKTFASVMLGAAMLRGAPIASDSTVKDGITVAHLLTHTSGLACDDNDDHSPGNEETMQSQTNQPDWWQYILDLPIVHEPGTHYAYCSGGMNLVGRSLTKATGKWLPELFDETIARPLGFGRYHFNLMPTLEGYQGGGVRLRPRDLLKLGQAYLDGGVWDGRRLVSRAWVEQSTTQQVPDSQQSADGYAWHRSTLRVGDKGYREYEANGNGGQFLMVVPELDLVVVFTA